MIETIAHLTCKCGQKFQVLKITIQIDENGSEIQIQDLDEEATAQVFSEHVCS